MSFPYCVLSVLLGISGVHGFFVYLSGVGGLKLKVYDSWEIRLLFSRDEGAVFLPVLDSVELFR